MGVLDWLAPGGRIAQHLPGYEVRAEQRTMAAAVAQALDEGRHLAVEAGTGVGKTFAYLLPAIEQIVQHKRRVVVSTQPNSEAAATISRTPAVVSIVSIETL